MTRFAEWLEDSYKKKFQKNGKVMLVLFLKEYIKVSMTYFFCIEILHSFINIFDLYALQD
jgi:uncharacterized protein YeeX (DUF496 family)